MEWAENVGEPDRWREYWQEPESRLIHFIGKDNTVFHTLIWPAQLMGTAEDGEEPFVLPYDVPANEFMNLEVLVDGERRAMQMSTSRNLAVWLHEALDRFPADPLRFYLASSLPETGDVVFSWRDFQSRVNSDLIGNLGNYINRVLSFAEKYFDGDVPRPEELPEDSVAVLEDFTELEARYEAKMLAPRPREALGELLAMGRSANRFFDASAPWKTRKEDPEQTRLTLYTCSVLLGSLAYHAAPYVPEAIGRLEEFFEGPIARVSDLEELPKGYRAAGAKPLFRRIEGDEVAAAEGHLSRAVSGEAG
jgi:methionyl-tRNA synthetase